MMNISFTKFKNLEGRLTKTAFEEEGEIVTQGYTNLRKGEFEDVTIDWKDFGSYLDSLSTEEAIALGRCQVVKEDGETLTRAGIKPYKFFKNKKYDKTFRSVARVKDNFKWAAGSDQLILLDVDGIEDRDAAMEDVFADLLTKLPELRNIQSGFWLTASASSYLSKEGCKSTGLKGLHCHFILPSIYSVDDLKDYIEGISWELGNVNCKISDGIKPRILTYFPVDTSVFSPERLIYESGSECSGNVTQARPLPMFIESKVGDKDKGVLNLLAYDETKAEQNKLSVLKSMEKEQAKVKEHRKDAMKKGGGLNTTAVDRAYDLMDQDLFPGSMTIFTDYSGEVKAWELLLFPDKWHEKTCRDPYEPDYQGGSRNKAMIYTNDGGARIHSFAHGEALYTVVMDRQSIKEIFDRYSEGEMEGMGVEWAEILANATIGDGVNELESKKVIQAVSKKMNMDIAEVRQQIQSAGKEVNKSKLKQALEELNQRWAVVKYGNKVRYVTESYNPETGFLDFQFCAKEDFKNAEESNTVFEIVNGKPKPISVAAMWLKWPKRRSYHGVVFDPTTTALEIDGYMNMYRGLTTARKAKRRCGMTKCKGQGCFRWSVKNKFEVCDADKSVSKATIGNKDDRSGSNWTYYVNHIYENVCGKDKKSALWVLDWICDVLKNPTNRPGTALCIRGGQGCGKGVVFQPLQELLGRYHYHTSNIDDLTDKFNVFLQNNIFLFADEAVWGGGHKSASRMKTMVTEKLLSVEPKGVDRMMVKNFLHIGISSNADWVIPAEADERRYTVFNIGDGRRKDGEFFSKVTRNCMGNFLEEVMNWDIKSDLTKIVMNDALKAQKEQLGHPPEVEFLLDIIDSGWIWSGDREDGNVSVQALKAKAESGKYRPHDMTERQFMQRFNRLLVEMGIKNPSKDKVLVVGEDGRGKQVASTRFGLQRELISNRVYRRLNYDE